MKRRRKWLGVSNFILVLVTVLTVPLLYQNCGDIDGSGHLSSLSPGIDIKIQNGKGTVIPNGGDLCTGADNEAQSRSVVLSITTSSLAETYYCRRPSLDNSVWNCNEARSLVETTTITTGTIMTVMSTSTTRTIGSEGEFTILDSASNDDTGVELSYESLPDGRYKLEISAEGGSDGENPWTTISKPVSFVVKDCLTTSSTSSTTTSTSTTTGRASTCADTNPSQDGNQPYNCSQHDVPNNTFKRKNPLPTTGPVSAKNCCNHMITDPRWWAICADTNPSKSGSQPFPCSSGWSYKTSANSFRNPSRERCCTPPPTATCSDTDPSKSGSQPFPCPSGWSYKTSANSLTSPSQERCCAPPATATCSDRDPLQNGNQKFSCTGSSVYKKSAAKSTNPSESVCCECRSGYVGTPPNCRCPAGKEEYGNSCVNECRADQERNSSNGECGCPSGEIEQGGRCITRPTRTCADMNSDGVTGDWYDCRDLHGVNNNFSNGHLRASRENCCQGICEGYNCSQHNSPSWSYALKNPLPASGKNNKANCCDGSLKGTCGDADLAKSGPQPFICRSAHSVYKSSSSQSKNPSESVCCQCGPGYVGTPPDCRGCPPGQISVQGRCVPIPRINPGVGGGGGSL